MRNSIKEMQVCHASCGCEVSSCCLTCPLPRCRFDLSPAEWQAMEVQVRNVRIVAALDAGESHADVAQQYGLSRRSIDRVIAEGKGE